MSGTVRNHAVSKWVPAAVAVVVVAGVAIAVPVAANASVQLPSKTPAQVLELMESSKVTAFSGEITETSDLGLPALPATGQPGGSDAVSSEGGPGGSSADLAGDLALLTGTNSLRVYVDGSKNIRLQDLGSLSERDVIRNGNNVWTYDSKSNAVEHAVLTANSNRHFSRPGSASGMASAPDATSIPQTPSGLADAIVAKLDKSSTLRVDDAVRVAGRPAYDLVLTPKATDTLVGSVSIAVDAETGLPLQVQVDAVGQSTPAVSIGFTSLSLATPDASLFNFTPPAGAKVTLLTKPHAHPESTSPAKPSSSKATEKVTGRGWDAVITISPSAGSRSTEGSELSKLATSPEFAELTTSVAGGRVLHTSLFNVLFTSDGRIVAGAVSIARLQAVAAAQ